MRNNKNFSNRKKEDYRKARALKVSMQNAAIESFEEFLKNFDDEKAIKF